MIIFTDGSSRGNPGPGGCGAILIFPDKKGGKLIQEVGIFAKMTTNNRMELMAVIRAFIFMEENFKKLFMEINDLEIYTDSSYLLNGITAWIYAWQKNNWKLSTDKNQEVANKDLWQQLISLKDCLQTKKIKINWKKIKGHSVVVGNQIADQIATEYADKKKREDFFGDLKVYEVLNEVVILDNLKNFIENGGGKEEKKEIVYLSLVEGKLFRDKTWAECEKRVKGKKGVKFKKITNSFEEKEILQKWER